MNIFSIVHYSIECLRQDDPVQEIFKVQISQLIAFFPYSPFVAFIGKFINIVATFAWNYMDLFIMIVSVGLSSRFKQINEELRRVKGEVNNHSFFF